MAKKLLALWSFPSRDVDPPTKGTQLLIFTFQVAQEGSQCEPQLLWIPPGPARFAPGVLGGGN